MKNTSALNIPSARWRAKRRALSIGKATPGVWYLAVYVLPEGETMWHFSHTFSTHRDPTHAATPQRIPRRDLERRLPRLAPFSINHLNEIDFWK